MKKMKRWLLTVITLFAVCAFAFGAVACGEEEQVEKGEKGDTGKSAYEIWLDCGHVGTEDDFFAWLKGEKGEKGDQGEQGDKGEQGATGETGESGASGKSAYQIWLNSGHIGSEADFLEWLQADVVEHVYGEWRMFTDEETSCENRMYYRVCGTCNGMEWKRGVLSDHDWEQVYSKDDTYHWYACRICGAEKEKREHSIGNDGACSVCHESLAPTQGIVYEIDNVEARVTGYEGSATKIRIDSTYQGMPVTEIGERAFENFGNITEIFIPKSVKEIGSRAFLGCAQLKSVTFEESSSLTKIGNSVFYNCGNLQELTFPVGLKTVGDSVFFGCEKLSFYEHDNVKYFKNGNNPYFLLVEAKVKTCWTYTIHPDTQVIASFAFYDCTYFTEILIPESVAGMGHCIFHGCEKLTTIYCELEKEPIIWEDDWYHSDNSANPDFPIYWYSDALPIQDGRFWHYVNGVVVKW